MYEDIVLNKYQTPISELGLEKQPQEVQDQFWDFFHNVPFIQSMVSPNRPRACDLPRDEDGKIIVDITKPHTIENIDYFRPSAIHYQKYGRFTDLRPNANPNSEFGKWIREERRRCLYGYVRPSDGEWITGDHYFFLNYCPISLLKKSDKDSRKAMRVIDFPFFWDGHYYKFHYLNQARENGYMAAELASRQKGKSFSAASMLAKRFVLGESFEVNKRVVCYVTAIDKAKLLGGDQTLDKFQFYIDFIAEHMQWPSRRLFNSLADMNWQMGYKDLNTGTNKGTLNSVVGKSSQADASKLRGSRGVLYLFEEAGTFDNLLTLWNNLLPSVSDGDSVYGLLYAYGCCCAGTTLFKANGEPIKIEDVKLDDNILGFNGIGYSDESVSWLQPIGYKNCLKITTEKANELSCSDDHPILAINKDARGNSLGTCSFYRAHELKVGDTLIMPKCIGKFGNIHEDNAYLLGALFGDGSYSGTQCVMLSISTNEEYEYYNNRYDIGISKLSKGDNVYAQLYFRMLHPLLEKYKMDRQAYENKKLPYNIFDWDRESVAAFLGGYFNADGNIQIVKKKHRSIKLTCKYKLSLEQVKALLSKFGISSHIYIEHKHPRILKSRVNATEYQMKDCDTYVLYISSAEDIVTFRDNIKFLVKAKQERLDSYVSCPGKRIPLKIELRDNGKGKEIAGAIINEYQPVTIKSIEELGVQRIYNLTANTTHTYISNGFVSANTTGDVMSDFAAMQEIMYNPVGYKAYGINNVFDKEGQGRPKFTFFFPAYMNMSEAYDENGNSDVTKALIKILADRYEVKYNSTDINTITKRIAEMPITPQEALLRSRGNMFPVADLTQRLAEIDNDPHTFDDVYVGDLTQEKDGTVSFKLTGDQPIRDFPLKDNKVTGALEIFKMPEKDAQGKVFPQRYIIGHDPVDNDEADTMSLSSTFVLDLWTDAIVAEYTGRHQFADDNFEILRKLCIFYNAKALVEMNIKGCFSYFSRMNSLYLLADTPEYLKDKDIIKNIGIGNNSKGVKATKPVNDYANRLIRDWLLKPITIQSGEDGEETTVFNLTRLRNRALIKELMLYNPDINVDRVRALGLLMLYREQFMVTYNGDPSSSQNAVESDYLGNDDYFSRNYDNRLRKYSDNIANG